MGVVSLSPTVGSVLATPVLPDHLCLGEKERWHDPSPYWCAHETPGQIHPGKLHQPDSHLGAGKPR